MKVSIITVCLNSSETIEDTIRSIRSQDYKDIEYIIIDGGSTDGTLDIINRYKENIAKVISEPDEGIYDAMNKGIKLTNGDIIAMLNGDDVYADSSVVRRMVNIIESEQLDAAYADLIYVACNNINKAVRYWRPGQYKKNAFLKGWVPPHPTFFCKKKAYEKFGYFNNKFKVAADFELMLRFVEKHQIKTGYLPEVIVKMRTGGKANVLRGIIGGNWEIIRSFQLNNLRLSPWFFILKPLAKISQFFVRPSKLNNKGINL